MVTDFVFCNITFCEQLRWCQAHTQTTAVASSLIQPACTSLVGATALSYCAPLKAS